MPGKDQILVPLRLALTQLREREARLRIILAQNIKAEEDVIRQIQEVDHIEAAKLARKARRGRVKTPPDESHEMQQSRKRAS